MKQQHCYLETFQSSVWSQLGSGGIISDSQNWITDITGNKRKRRDVFMTFNHVCSQNFISTCVAECVSLLERQARVLEKRARHLCYPNDPHACVGLSQVRLMHGSCGAERSGPRRLNRPGIISQCGPRFALSEGTASPPRGGRPPESEVRRRRARDPPPCRRNQVLSVWLGTAPSISAVCFPLPRIKSAPGNTSAPMTGRQDKQSSVPKFCHACLLCKRNSDDVFITTSNWFGPSCDKRRYGCSVTSFVIRFARRWVLRPSRIVS